MVGGAHAPAPLQRDTGENVEPVHEAVPHDTAVDACWQAPEPSQAPVLPHGGLGGQPPTTWPAAMLAQLPAPLTLHAWHSGQLPVPQHTPSVQNPLMHWLPAEQVWPFGFSAQLPD